MGVLESVERVGSGAGVLGSAEGVEGVGSGAGVLGSAEEIEGVLGSAEGVGGVLGSGAGVLGSAEGVEGVLGSVGSGVGVGLEHRELGEPEGESDDVVRVGFAPVMVVVVVVKSVGSPEVGTEH